MPLRSPLLSGSPTLVRALQGPPPIQPLPSPEDSDAVERVQRALVQLGFLPGGFGDRAVPDEGFGLFGSMTERAVKAFQKTVFPHAPLSWDGRVGMMTLSQLDAKLQLDAPLPEVRDSITQTRPNIAAMSYRYTSVVEPLSVTQTDIRTHAPADLRPILVDYPIRWLMLDVRKWGRKFWVGAAVPADLTEFNEAHVFFHPAPAQAGLNDGQYDEFTGGWDKVERYVPWLGTQLAAAGRRQVLFVPYMTSHDFSSLGLLETDPLSRLVELLGAVQRAVTPLNAVKPSLRSLGASSFSVGITCLATFIARIGSSEVFKEAFDFDGAFSNSPYKLIASLPGGTFKKYSQAEPAVARHGDLNTPLPRWKNHPERPRTPSDVHALMPNLFFHAASTR